MNKRLEPPTQAFIVRDLTLKTGSPLGITNLECTSWVKTLNLKFESSKKLYTGCLYQIMSRAYRASTLLGLLEKSEITAKLVRRILRTTSSIFWKIVPVKSRGIYEKALKGIVKTLTSVYPEISTCKNDVYAGVLLLELGFTREFKDLVEGIVEKLESENTVELVTVDPHTTEALKFAVKNLNSKIRVRHYVEVLSEKLETIEYPGKLEVVVHDPCILSRVLNLHSQFRSVLYKIKGLKVLEPKKRGLDTSCCGGPIELYKPSVSSRICKSRIEELKASGSNTVLVACPICLFNFSQYGRGEVEVLDLGNVLLEASS